MDFCRNMTVSGEYHKQQEQAPPASTLDDLFSAQDTEVDVSLEWLSVFVEDCLSSTGNCLPLPNQNLHQTSNNQATTTPPPTIKPTFQQQQQKTQQNPSSPPFEKFPVPGKARRSKRNRVITTNAKTRRLNPLLTSWSYNSHLNLPPSDPPLLHQTHWLADSELIISPKKQELGIKFVTRFEDDQEINAAGLGLMSSSYVNGNDKDKDKGSTGLQQQQQPRRCTHCLSQRTPQWRAGPLGPKTLCNACGVRYKSGRLLPEYRPAKSPTFSTNLHSNSHKKVLEMRNMVSSTSTTTTTTTTSPTPSTSIPLIPSHNYLYTTIN